MGTETQNAGTGGSSDSRSQSNDWDDINNVVSNDNNDATCNWVFALYPGGTDYLNVPINNFSITFANYVVAYIRHWASIAVSEQVRVEFSPDNGSSWCSTSHVIADPPTSEALVSTSNCQHHTWNAAALDNMRVRYWVSGQSSGGSVYHVDHIYVTATYSDVTTPSTSADPTLYPNVAEQIEVTKPTNPGDGGASITHWQVRWDNDSGCPSPIDDSGDIDIGTTTYDITGQGNNTLRYASVRFKNSQGYGDWSVGTVSATTWDVGTATFLNIQSISALSAVGGGGAATIVESYDPYDPNALDHVRGNARETVVVMRPDGVFGFRGEINKITIGYDTITYLAEEGLRKLNDSFCNINPIVFKSDIRQVKDGVIRDDFADWIANDYDDKVLITRDSELFKKTDFPSSVEAHHVGSIAEESETWVPEVPDNEGGNTNVLYFDEEQEVPNVYGIHHEENLTAGIVFTFKTYDRETIDVEAVVNIDVDIGISKGTVERISGSWLEDGFEEGMTIRLSRTGNSNDGYYIISTVSASFMVFTTVIAGGDVDSDEPNITQVMEWDDITLKSIARFTSLAGSKVFGTGDWRRSKTFVYNYSTTTWDQVYLYSQDTDPVTNVHPDEEWNTASLEAADQDGGKSPVITHEHDLLSILDVSSLEFKQQYMDMKNNGDKNTSNFVEYELKVRIRSPQLAFGLEHSKIEVHYLGFNFSQENTKITSQGQKLSAGLIDFNNANSIYLEGSAGWELDTFPQGDGVSVGDEYIITDTIQNVLDEIFDADPVFSVDQTISATGHGETEDLTDTPKYDVLQKYSDMLNLVFWYLGESNTIVITDTLSSSGIELTIADVVGWNEGSWKLTLDYSEIKENIKYVGDGGLSATRTDMVDYNIPDDYDDPILGREDVVYRDDELYTQRNVDEAADSKEKLHSTVRETIPLPIDLTDGNRVQDYTALTVGSTVAFTGSILGDYDAGNLGELMVESISMDIDYDESDEMHVVFNLQKRVI